jgi:hypothetical protein
MLIMLRAMRTLERFNSIVRSFVKRQLLRRRELPSTEATNKVGGAAVVRNLVAAHQTTSFERASAVFA